MKNCVLKTRWLNKVITYLSLTNPCPPILNFSVKKKKTLKKNKKTLNRVKFVPGGSSYNIEYVLLSIL